MNILLLFISAAVVNNFVLTYFLGICPFLGVTGKIKSALGMGIATTFVMTLTGGITWIVYHLILKKFGVPYLEYVAYILVIASLVQIIEMFIRKSYPSLYRALGIYLPLITTNCAILGLALFATLRDYGFLESVVFGFGAGVGFTFVMLIMSAIREELDLADVPQPFRGAAITLIIAGLLALTFMGFSGLIYA